jgi:predicted transcriptional regulator
MEKMAGLGELERAVMEHLWSSDTPQTVRQVHEGLAERSLAYTTVMTVLQRLSTKGLVAQLRGDRAYRYTAASAREELVAELMFDALNQAPATGGRVAALVHFVERVDADEADALRQALAALEARTSLPTAARNRKKV